MIDLNQVDMSSIKLYTHTYQGELDEVYIEEAYYKDGTLLSDDDLDDLERGIGYDKLWEMGYDAALESAIETADFMS